MKKQKIIAFLGILAISGLFFSSNSFAAEDKSAQIRAIKDEKLEMTLSSDNILLILDDDSMKVEHIMISANTNSPVGYTISIGPKNDYLDLRKAGSDGTIAIPTITGIKNYENINETSWGYSVVGTTFTGLKEGAESIFRTSVGGRNEHVLGIGARAIGNDISAGAYENEIVFTAVGNLSIDLDDYAYVVCNPNADSIDNAVCMQDINENVKNSMIPETQYALYDSRDGNKYFVAKMSTGTIWMTKNLNLDLSTDVTLTNKNTDLNTKSQWTPTRDTKRTIDAEFAAELGDSFNPGEIYSTGYTGRTIYNTYDEKGRFLENTNSCDFSLTECQTGFSRNKIYNGQDLEHYLVGIYYPFITAAAMDDEFEFEYSDSVMEAKNSICPRGWHLPTKEDYFAINVRDNTALNLHIYLDEAPYYMGAGGQISGRDLYSIDGTKRGTRYWSSSYTHKNGIRSVAEFSYSTGSNYSNMSSIDDGDSSMVSIFSVDGREGEYNPEQWSNSDALRVRCVAR